MNTASSGRKIVESPPGHTHPSFKLDTDKDSPPQRRVGGGGDQIKPHSFILK